MVPGSLFYLEPWLHHHITRENQDSSTYLFVKTMSRACVIIEIHDILAY